MTTKPLWTFECGPRPLGLLVALVVALGAGTAAAQSEADPSATESPRPIERGSTEDHSVPPKEYFGDAHRRRLYEEGKLEYPRAALWTALLPGLGNFYARQYFIGGLNASLMGFTALLVPYGFATSQMGFVWTGAGLAGTAYLSGFATSYIGVKNYNRRLRRSLRVSDDATSGLAPPSPSRANFVPGISVQFRF